MSANLSNHHHCRSGGPGSLGLVGCQPQHEQASEPEAHEPETLLALTNVSRVRTTCGNCHNDCGVVVTVSDGVAVSIEGDPDHPFNKGALCPKGQAFVDVIYSPDRLKYPMKRDPQYRGDSSKWEKCTWDEAFAYIAEQLSTIKEKYGAHTLLYTNGAPVQNIVRNGRVLRPIRHQQHGGSTESVLCAATCGAQDHLWVPR